LIQRVPDLDDAILPAFAGQLSDAQIRAVARYVSTATR
jgi:mono/diheme cytochrome c family protein